MNIHVFLIHIFLKCFYYLNLNNKKTEPVPVGFEPTTSELTAPRYYLLS